jgi:hypothetical protein
MQGKIIVESLSLTTISNDNVSLFGNDVIDESLDVEEVDVIAVLESVQVQYLHQFLGTFVWREKLKSKSEILILKSYQTRKITMSLKNIFQNDWKLYFLLITVECKLVLFVVIFVPIF